MASSNPRTPFARQPQNPVAPQQLSLSMPDNLASHWRIAWWLALATIGYNVLEGLFCTRFGYHDESVSLFGFGLDSFIECISGLGIAHLVWRSRNQSVNRRDDFERTALRVTGTAFYLLAVGLAFTAALNLYQGHLPATTWWGVGVAVVSLSVMWAMIWQKERTGKALQSEAMLADAQCARVCMWMSVILLISSGLYVTTSFAYADILGAMGLAIFSWREGKECFEKASSEKMCTCH